MATRTTLIAGVVGIATIVALGLYAVLAPRTAEDPGDASDPTGPASVPGVVPVDQHEATRLRHDLPWPFEQFSADIDRVRRPRAMEAHNAYREKVDQHSKSWEETRFSITVVDQRLQDLIPVIAQHFTHTGTPVFTQPPHFEDEMRFSLDMTDVSLAQVVRELRRQSFDRLQSEVLPQGIVIGTRNAVMEARLEGNEWKARRRSRHPSDDDPLLQKRYRPDFEGAHISAVIRDIREKTDVEVIVGRQLWARPVKLDWRSDPMLLRQALDALAKQMRGTWYLHEGRIYLLAR